MEGAIGRAGYPFDMPASEKTYVALALEDPEGNWEQYRGRVRRKPSRTFSCHDAGRRLFTRLTDQLPEEMFVVSFNSARLSVPGSETHFIPDVAVIPIATTMALQGRQDVLEEYPSAVPFVAEVWSPSTGEYDVGTKLPEYRARGDLEIWRVHPYERTLIAWRRQPGGSYSETQYRGGEVPVASLPGVSIRLESLFR